MKRPRTKPVSSVCGEAARSGLYASFEVRSAWIKAWIDYAVRRCALHCGDADMEAWAQQWLAGEKHVFADVPRQAPCKLERAERTWQAANWWAGAQDAMGREAMFPHCGWAGEADWRLSAAASNFDAALGAAKKGGGV